VTLSPELVRKLAAAGKRATVSRAERDALIRETLTTTEATLREVAEAVGLTHVAVMRIRDR
jgi:hypothetical protein